ncbi:MAG: hypothetical protein K2J18_03380, partial [Paramuribaculum sp.]|nr:hypothetical protein [Paramuribaculum sp.]
MLQQESGLLRKAVREDIFSDSSGKDSKINRDVNDGEKEFRNFANYKNGFFGGCDSIAIFVMKYME